MSWTTLKIPSDLSHCALEEAVETYKFLYCDEPKVVVYSDGHDDYVNKLQDDWSDLLWWYIPDLDDIWFVAGPEGIVGSEGA